MNWKKITAIVLGAAVACFSIGCFIGYYSTQTKEKGVPDYVVETKIPMSAETYAPTAQVDGEITQTELGFVYCILANDSGLYMYKISATGSEMIASDKNVVQSLLPDSDRYRLANGIECNSAEEAWSLWECFTS